MVTTQPVTLYQSRREDGFSVEVRRQHGAVLHRTDAYRTSSESWEAAYLWMRQNGLAPGPYRVESDAEEGRGMGTTPAGSTDRARELVTREELARWLSVLQAG
jgi:hypothetical protein